MNLIFCVPGKQFSDKWLQSWISTTNVLSKNKISWGISINYDPVVYFARNRILGASNVNGSNQKPFKGEIKYDYLIWIDSDIVWTGNDVLALLQHNKDIVNGCYIMQDNNHYPIVEHLDYNNLATNGTFDFLTKDQLNSKTSPFCASYAGFGFTAVKYGVFENMEYPWFRPRWVNYGQFSDFTAEDVGFCWIAKDLGYDIWIDPAIRVKHEKNILLG